MTEKIEQTLAVRKNSHGEWTENARVIQNIKRAMRDSPNWESLPDFMKESLEMDAVKTGRILVGDPDLSDHWHDKAGYAKLSEDRCQPKPVRFEVRKGDTWKQGQPVAVGYGVLGGKKKAKKK